MYGIVKQSIKDLVTENFGAEAWQKIKETSKVEQDNFLNNETYEDSITYELAGATAEVLGISLHDVLVTFGEYWVLKTGKEKYGALMKSGGANLEQFLTNLPNFHSRVMLMYPNLTPPEFKVSDIADKQLHLHYYSQREGLMGFVVGLIQGLGKLFDTEVDVDMISSRAEGADHEVFQVKW